MSFSDQDKSKQEALEEKKKWSVKYFDYAESPIKEWIAAHVGESVEVMFDDYNDYSELLSVEIGQEHYTFYLTPFPNNVQDANARNSDAAKDTAKDTPSTPAIPATPVILATPAIPTAFDISKQEFKEKHQLQKAAVMMFEAVYTVFTAVIKSMPRLPAELEDIFPDFNETGMYFIFRKANKAQIEKTNCEKMLCQISEQYERIKDRVGAEADELRNKLVKLQKEQLDKRNEITDEMIRKNEEHCNAANASLANGEKLYIVLEKNVKPNDESIMRRLPEFGLKYQDPTEETAVEKFKKEYDVNE